MKLIGNQDFDKQLEESLYIHKLLRADESLSLEREMKEKKAANSTSVWDGESLERWRFEGEGAAQAENGVLVLVTLSRSDHWPGAETRAVDAASGDYATFGSYEAKLDLKGLELGDFNRISFKARPLCNGLHSPIIRAAFVNNGVKKLPDAYSREGFNAINLENFAWNDCFWEIESLPHDKIEELSFIVHRYGQELSGGKALRFEIKDIRVEQVSAEVTYGWECPGDEIAYPFCGYFSKGEKKAVANANASEKRFQVVSNGEVKLEAEVSRVETAIGAHSVLDFSSLKEPGLYSIVLGGKTFPPFAVSSNPYTPTIWRLINFLFAERCGCPVPGKHGTCHGDVTAIHDGKTLAYNGGWHDAADVSQQTVQTAEIAHALVEIASSVKASEPKLYARLLEEAQWGLDFVLKTRFGDGYRATGSSIRRWTDGMIGGMDDCEARVHNHSFENFIMSGVEADAGEAFREHDPAFAWKCRDAAKEDFEFALTRFREVGLEEPVHHEHTASASLSQYYAAAAWSASKLFRWLGDERYAVLAREFASKLMACQETGEGLSPISGFFYRDERKSQIVHFSHQSREHLFVQALAEVCNTQPDHLEKAAWETSMRLYGSYLKKLMTYVEPYGMIPAGVFNISEVEDQEAFSLVHPDVDFEKEKKSHAEQISNGSTLGSGFFVKRFPVWFSFRGNSAVHLSMGKAASVLGRHFEDEALMDIAKEQIYWVGGKNPFRQSLIYGDGRRYGQQYTALLGETVGEMPVGVQTRGNEDAPYWPQANIATYREVWTTPPGRWLWIMADVLGMGAGKGTERD
ncbi:MAG: glycoside hydrolase family 9 protein [Clostridiales bacterium]|nr:glycoside hydrolase family 9 protein [Clostridiales bacterium]